MQANFPILFFTIQKKSYFSVFLQTTYWKQHECLVQSTCFVSRFCFAYNRRSCRRDEKKSHTLSALSSGFRVDFLFQILRQFNLIFMCATSATTSNQSVLVCDWEYEAQHVAWCEWWQELFYGRWAKRSEKKGSHVREKKTCSAPQCQVFAHRNCMCVHVAGCRDLIDKMKDWCKIVSLCSYQHTHLPGCNQPTCQMHLVRPTNNRSGDWGTREHMCAG